MTTELEQARAHLRDCQKALKHARDVSVFEQGQWWPENMKANAERAVIAALSWVWDAQERTPITAGDEVTVIGDTVCSFHKGERAVVVTDMGDGLRISPLNAGPFPGNYFAHRSEVAR
jgi:hypothetical protein